MQPLVYACLLQRPLVFHFVQLIRGETPEIKVFETNVLPADLDWFNRRYLPTKAKAIDQTLQGLDEALALAKVREWWSNPTCLDIASWFFSPSPGWACAYCPVRRACGYRLETA